VVALKAGTRDLVAQGRKGVELAQNGDVRRIGQLFQAPAVRLHVVDGHVGFIQDG
jgi:hypothetical protein